VRRALIAALLSLSACPTETAMPGDQGLGSYRFDAEPLELDCLIDGISDEGFSFDGTFSRDSVTNEAWFHLNGVVREASFDGQVARATYAAPRSFASQCDGCATELRETIAVAILSKSQNDAAGDACPDGALDGGLLPGSPPGPVASGYDALRACGELLDEVVATPIDGQGCAAECGACRLRYRLKGARR
jgi:hypothetical protein